MKTFKTMKYYSLIALLVVLYSCGAKNSNLPVQTVQFDISATKDEIPSPEVLQGLEIVKLETTPASLVGSISDIIVTKQYIYIADCRNLQVVYVFDRNGKFIQKVGNQGSASNEYVQLSSMFFDTEDNSINLLSRMPSKILKYTCNGDSLLNIINLDKYYMAMDKVENSYVGYKGNTSQKTDDTNLDYIDENGKFHSGWMKIEKGWESIGLNNKPLYKSNEGDVYYLKPFENKIYSYDNEDGVVPIIQLDFGKHNPTEIITSYPEYEKHKTDAVVFYIKQYYETPNSWYFYFMVNGKQYISVYNKLNKTAQVYNPSVSNEEYFLPFGNIISFSDNKLITSIDASELDLYLTGKNEYNDFTKEYQVQIERLNKQLGKVDPNDNPILVMYSLN